MPQPEKDATKAEPQPTDNLPPRENVGPEAAREVDRGRLAESPSGLTAKGWWDVLWRTKQQVRSNNLQIVAAGVGFYAFVAVVPALAVVIAIYALVANAGDLSRHLDILSRIVPQAVMPLLQDQLTRIVKNNTAAGISAVVGVLLALYSSSNATKAMITGMNVAYDEKEKRGFFKLNLTALILTLGGILGMTLAGALIAAAPAIIRSFGIQASWVSWLRWPALIVLFIIGVSIVYRFGPSRTSAKWRWISAGAILSSLLWVGGSAIFSYYVTRFGSYEKTYGSLGAVVIFLLWFYLSAYVVLIGAELNAELERQTVKDTTVGPSKAMGDRGAFAADTVGRSHPSSTQQTLKNR